MLYQRTDQQRARKPQGLNLLFMVLIAVLCFTQLSFAQEVFSPNRRLAESDEEGDENQILDGADSDTSSTGSSPGTSSGGAAPPDTSGTNDTPNMRGKINVAGKGEQTDYEIDDIRARYEKGSLKVEIESISPRGGPKYGDTRVTVRASGLAELTDAYPEPKCKFGSNQRIVDAIYIKCTTKPPSFYAKDSIRGTENKQEVNDTCIQCEASPKTETVEIVPLTVSLTGKFDDATSSHPYRYYNPAKVSYIYPRQGPKDGETVVKVIGHHFIDFGDDFRCNFGTHSSKAHFMTQELIWCRAPASSVVGRPMPFSISLNRQQNSLQKVDYWYYNMQGLTKVSPDYAPMSGGTTITLQGSNFYPFDYKKDIDTSNDTFCSFGPLGKMPAKILSSTHAECVTVPNHLHTTARFPVKLTINNQNYTDDDDSYFEYFNPPSVLDAGPLIGPVRGGTEITIWGSSFQRRNITCKFGAYESIGKFVSKSQIKCTAPKVMLPGDYKLQIEYQGDRFQSGAYNFKYFASPIVSALDPACGPVEGYTQIKVIGSNFMEFGFGQAKCIYNLTYSMNATVIDSNTIICDSPMLESLNGDMWYNISVTLDGQDVSNTDQKFMYYQQPTIKSVTPWMGPLSGGTKSTITGTGFTQKNICNLQMRYEQKVIAPDNVSNTQLDVVSPPANVSGAIVVSVSGNNQQFINDRTLHYRDIQNTFEYYQNFIVEDIKPAYVSNSGNTPLRIKGMLFNQFRHDNGTEKFVQLYCRFIDSAGNVIDKPKKMKYITNNQEECVAPKTDITGTVKLEMGLNLQQWHDVGQTLEFYNGPKVISVAPTYGVTKNPKGTNLQITGDNFECPKSDCRNIRVRFRNSKGDEIYEDGKMNEAKQVVCKIPKYPAPETLVVDVSFNGQDFTNDGVTYGFMDPYVLGINPRMLSTSGSTHLTLHGYGFVQNDDSEILYKDQKGNAAQCGSNMCTKVYKVIDEHTTTVNTFPQSEMMVDNGGKNVEFEPFFLNMKNPDKDWSKNNIDICYYKDVIAKKVSSSFAYANEEKPVVVSADFSWNKGNQYKNFKKYAKFTCRFTSTNQDKAKQVVVDAIMETSPIGSYDKNSLPDQIRCRTPKWGYTDVTSLDFSVNGQDYFGNYPYNFVEKLQIYRIAPMSGPVEGSTAVKLYGSGFLSSIPKETEIFVKFGLHEMIKVDKSAVTQGTWNDDAYYDDFHFPKQLLHQAEQSDHPISEGDPVDKYTSAKTPDISKSSTGSGDPTDFHGVGGPVYVQIGERVELKEVSHAPGSAGTISEDPIDTVFHDSSNLEFYYYKQPSVYKVEPSSGLTSGGTDLTVTGAWFMQKPEYGVFPFCKIGDHVVRGRFIQTNRIICKTPPSDVTGAPSAIAVSLNGVDWKETNFKFSYYERPVITDVAPKSGDSAGGTELWLKGTKFSNITQTIKTVQCRFRKIVNNSENIDEIEVPTKFIPAYYIDKETMKCGTPAGFNGGDQVKVDLTFNGFDYTEASYVFSYYSIYSSFPKSGPFDAVNQHIQIKGKGFRSESTILCSLNKVEVAPLKVEPDVIRCPMIVDESGVQSSDKDSVPFLVSIDQNKHDLGNFHYYKQITLTDVTPTIGPNEGKGAIYFMGENFRDDFENARLGCRIGNTLGQAILIDDTTIRCTLVNKIPLVDEGQSLLVSVALNSYSWAASEFSFLPYGIDAVYPSSGPISENTNVIVTGKGFENELKDQARCKFGTEDNYVIVEAQVLDNEHLICKSPSEQITLPDGADEIVQASNSTRNYTN